MELTKEHFDQTVKSLATKQQVNDLGEQIEELARMTKGGFDDVLERLDVRERVQKLEKEIAQMKSALHLN